MVIIIIIIIKYNSFIRFPQVLTIYIHEPCFINDLRKQAKLVMAMEEYQ